MRFDDNFKALIGNPDPTRFKDSLRSFLHNKPIRFYPDNYQQFMTWWQADSVKTSVYATFDSSSELTVAGQVKKALREKGQDPDRLILEVIGESLHQFFKEGLDRLRQSYPIIANDRIRVELETKLVQLLTSLLYLCGREHRQMLKPLLESCLQREIADHNPNLPWLNQAMGMENYHQGLAKLAWDKSDPGVVLTLKDQSKQALLAQMQQWDKDSPSFTDRLAARALIQYIQSHANAESSNTPIAHWLTLGSAASAAAATAYFFPFYTIAGLVIGQGSKSLFGRPGTKVDLLEQLGRDYRNLSAIAMLYPAAFAVSASSWAISPVTWMINWTLDKESKVQIPFQDAFASLSPEFRLIVQPLIQYCNANLRDQWFLAYREGGLKVNFFLDLLAQIYYVDKPCDQLPYVNYPFPHPDPKTQAIGHNQSLEEPPLAEKLAALKRILEKANRNTMVQEGEAHSVFERVQKYYAYAQAIQGQKDEEIILTLLLKIWDIVSSYDQHANNQAAAKHREGSAKAQKFWTYLTEVEEDLFATSQSKQQRFNAFESKTAELVKQFPKRAQGSTLFGHQAKEYESHIRAQEISALVRRLKVSWDLHEPTARRAASADKKPSSLVRQIGAMLGGR